MLVTTEARSEPAHLQASIDLARYACRYGASCCITVCEGTLRLEGRQSKLPGVSVNQGSPNAAAWTRAYHVCIFIASDHKGERELRQLRDRRRDSGILPLHIYSACRHESASIGRCKLDICKYEGRKKGERKNCGPESHRQRNEREAHCCGRSMPMDKECIVLSLVIVLHQQQVDRGGSTRSLQMRKEKATNLRNGRRMGNFPSEPRIWHGRASRRPEGSHC